MSNVLLGIGALPFAILGLFHLIQILVDLRRPRTFTPTDSSLVPTMRASGVAMSADSPSGKSMWECWQGVNITHSIGLIGFAALVGAAALRGAEPTVVAIAIAIGGAFAVAALRFFFRPPGVLATLGTLLFVAAAVS